MNLLAVETSSDVCGVAIAIDGQLVAVAEVHRAGAHDHILATLVQQACSHALLSLDDVDVVACSAGPGSFTGLRIGVSFVKGVCQMGTPKLISVPTMMAAAAASMEIAHIARKHTILTVVPSHRDRCFVQTFAQAGQTYLPTHDVVLESLEAARDRVTADVLVAGPGARLLDPDSISGISRLSSRFVVRAVAVQQESGSVLWTNPLEFEPLYVAGFGEPHSASSASDSPSLSPSSSPSSSSSSTSS